MTLGAFGVIIGLRSGDRRVEAIRQLAGLGWTQPWVAGAMAICLLSLSGIPPLLGFWGKFEIFTSALAAQGLDDTWSFLVLAILGVLNAAVGAYYYLRIVVLMYLYPAKEELRFRGGWPVAASVAACAVLTVVLGLFWAPVAETAREAARAAAAHPDPPGTAVTNVRRHEGVDSEIRIIPGYGMQRCPHLRRTRRFRRWIHHLIRILPRRSSG